MPAVASLVAWLSGNSRAAMALSGLLPLVALLGEYQSLAADAAWSGSRQDAVSALCANPLVLQLDLAERLYDDLAAAHRRYLPERLAA